MGEAPLVPAPAAQISWSRRLASVTPRPEPPYASGMMMPSQPPAAKARTNSHGYSALRSFSSQYSAENDRASVATSLRISSCCSVRAKSIPASSLRRECGGILLPARFHQLSSRHGGSGPVRAAERFHGSAALAAVLRRLLRGAHADPGLVLPDPDRRRADPLRHRALPAGRAWPAPQRSPGPLHRRGFARASAGRTPGQARRREHRGALSSPLRPRRRRRVVPRRRARRAEGRVRLRALSGAVLRSLLLPEELRSARPALAPARR